jgi:hypothetical protein
MGPQDVDAAERRRGIVDRGSHLFGPGQVGRDRRDLVAVRLHVGGKPGQPHGVDIDGGDARAFAQEQFDPGPAPAGGGGGDDGKLVGETHVFFLFLSFSRMGRRHPLDGRRHRSSTRGGRSSRFPPQGSFSTDRFLVRPSGSWAIRPFCHSHL